MKELEITIERLNRFFEKHVLEVLINETGDDDSPVISLNTKIQFTGVKDYIYSGEEKPTLQYTLYILPTNENLDKYYGLLANYFGEEVHVDTRSNAYLAIRWIVDRKVEDMLKYFSLENRAICTKVVNKIKTPIKEGLITESKVDTITRQIVKDIIDLFKFQRNGEFELPGDLRDDEMTYRYSDLPEFTVEVNVMESEDIDKFDVESEYYRDEDIIVVNIISKVGVKFTTLYGLIGELNEQVRHELEHMIQYNRGDKMPRKEPKDPFKYYTQPHELGAQVAGFRRKSTLTKSDFEKNVRDWFEINKFKHRLNPAQAEKVIEKILKKHVGNN